MTFKDIKIPKDWKRDTSRRIIRKDKVIAIRHEYRPFGEVLVIESPPFFPSESYAIEDSLQSSVNKLVNKYRKFKNKKEISSLHTNQPFVFGPKKM